jgi:O-antigen chain-terminating methyltransferase
LNALSGALSALRKVGGAPRSAKHTARLVLLHAVAYVQCRPALKQHVANLLARFPALRAYLARYAGFATAQSVISGTPLVAVESVERLTARAIHTDLVNAKSANTK